MQFKTLIIMVLVITGGGASSHRMNYCSQLDRKLFLSKFEICFEYLDNNIKPSDEIRTDLIKILDTIEGDPNAAKSMFKIYRI